MKAAAHLFPVSFSMPTPKDAALERDFVLGRQWAVDSTAYGKPYVFSRITPEAMWMVYAGPFVDEAAAKAYVHKL